MKQLSISAITDSSRFPVKKGTLQFLQDAYTEITAATIKALIGPSYSTSVIYVLSGVINSATAPTYTISAGAIFYNGEVFMFDAASFTATGTDVGVFSIIQTQYTTDADPVTFTDSTVRNIHNIRKMQLSAGASGSGLANYSQAFFLSFSIPAQFNLTAPTTSPYTGNQVQLIGSYPNIIAYVPPASALNPALASGSENIGNLTSGGLDITVTFGTPLATSNYTVMGSIISNGTADYDATILWNIRSRTTSGFIVHFREDAGVTQNAAWEWIAFAK